MMHWRWLLINSCKMWKWKMGSENQLYACANHFMNLFERSLKGNDRLKVLVYSLLLARGLSRDLSLFPAAMGNRI